MGMYLPIWFLYWFPAALMPNCILKGAIIGAVLLACGKCMHMRRVYEDWVLVKCFGCTMASELLGLFVFGVLEMNLPTDVYDAHYKQVSILAFAVTVISNSLLNYCIGLKRTGMAVKHRFVLTVLIAALTAPYLFVILEP